MPLRFSRQGNGLPKRFMAPVCLAFLVIPLSFSEVDAVIDTADSLVVLPGETYELYGVHSYNHAVVVHPMATLYVTDYGSGEMGTMELIAPVITIMGVIDADGRGFRNQQGPGRGTVDRGAGAGYGGRGGNSTHSGTGGGEAAMIGNCDQGLQTADVQGAPSQRGSKHESDGRG